ncbi:MAG: hypothetical protein H0W88_05355 [Parachlamydiaceae bacterium]|nr:hypothetical protein [Parachlamydiaceae bacterium]
MRFVYKNQKYLLLAVILICTLSFSVFNLNKPKVNKKIIICGVCRNIELSVGNVKTNMEALGKNFEDYAVIICENNSKDNTSALLKEWEKENPKVTIISEFLTPDKLPPHREGGIARARNVVLATAKNAKYRDFEYFIMSDLDFRSPWPIQEIINTINSPIEWDSVTANGLKDMMYWDHYTFLDAKYPFGAELMGGDWWSRLWNDFFAFKQDEWVPVYSAFGGLGIYKTATILKFAYSGTVTEDLQKYYKKIMMSTPRSHPELQRYLQLVGESVDADLSKVPIKFCGIPGYENPENFFRVVCSDHVPLHASMAMNGYVKMYVNPKMYMFYQKN